MSDELVTALREKAPMVGVLVVCSWCNVSVMEKPLVFRDRSPTSIAEAIRERIGIHNSMEGHTGFDVYVAEEPPLNELDVDVNPNYYAEEGNNE